ncbi:putative F-box protein At1g67623 [Salvia miltiorrhiza]|uniref:putative F-box protein At1g67623 n=1 Tax=Salvia miltiorrhiza TaxID=226208 RepID=UPI0025ABCA3D|nr:putative F-box protein At1g67623 [Salvia miltiorrhiza]
MTRYPKKNKVVSLIDTIPRELTTDILSRVSASSVADISSIKLSCKGLREIAEDEDVYRHSCLDKFPIVRWTPLCDKQQKFLNKCIQSANPEISYREALLDFFYKTEIGSACENLDKAVKSGHVGALYVSCIVFLFSGDDRLKREGVKLISKMKSIGYLKRKLRLCRGKLKEELRQMWVKNPLLREPPIICNAHRRCYRRANKWADEEEEEDDCEACAADRELELISIAFKF